MANTIVTGGFRQFGRQDGSSPTAGLTAYPITAGINTFHSGDVVEIAAGLFDRAGQGGQAIGIFYGCTYVDPATQKFIWNNQLIVDGLTGTAMTAYVCDDPEQLYVAQTSDAPLTRADVGTAVGFAEGIAPDAFGFSGDTIAANGNTFRVVALLSDFVSPSSMMNGLDNTSVGNFVIVAPNNFVRRDVLAAA